MMNHQQNKRSNTDMGDLQVDNQSGHNTISQAKSCEEMKRRRTNGYGEYEHSQASLSQLNFDQLQSFAASTKAFQLLHLAQQYQDLQSSSHNHPIGNVETIRQPTDSFVSSCRNDSAHQLFNLVEWLKLQQDLQLRQQAQISDVGRINQPTDSLASSSQAVHHVYEDSRFDEGAHTLPTSPWTFLQRANPVPTYDASSAIQNSINSLVLSLSSQQQINTRGVSPFTFPLQSQRNQLTTDSNSTQPRLSQTQASCSSSPGRIPTSHQDRDQTQSNDLQSASRLFHQDQGYHTSLNSLPVIERNEHTNLGSVRSTASSSDGRSGLHDMLSVLLQGLAPSYTNGTFGGVGRRDNLVDDRRDRDTSRNISPDSGRIDLSQILRQLCTPEAAAYNYVFEPSHDYVRECSGISSPDTFGNNVDMSRNADLDRLLSDLLSRGSGQRQTSTANIPQTQPINPTATQHTVQIPLLPKEKGRPQEPEDLDAQALTGRTSASVAISCDKEILSPYQCLVRLQIELFEATQEDVNTNAQGRNRPIALGQVGIRCRHCGFLAPHLRSRGSTYYPGTAAGLYQAAQNLASGHLCNYCRNIPSSIRDNLLQLRERKSSAGGGKKYWAEGVRSIGVFEDANGLRFKKER